MLRVFMQMHEWEIYSFCLSNMDFYSKMQMNLTQLYECISQMVWIVGVMHGVCVSMTMSMFCMV